MQHGGDADASAKVLRVGGDGRHRLRRRLEQQAVHRRLVLERDVRDLGRQREDDVEVADRQQVGLAFGELRAGRGTLAPGAVPVAAAVIGDPPVAAVGAGLGVAAERGGAAGLDSRHHLELIQAQVPGTGGPVRWAGGAEDVSNLERGAHRGSTGGCLPLHQRHQMVQRTGHCADRPGGDLGVERGRLELAVPEQHLNDADVDVLLE